MGFIAARQTPIVWAPNMSLAVTLMTGLVEHLASVTQASDMDSCLLEFLLAPRQAMHRVTCFVLLALACNSPDQIKHMEFGRGMTQQMSEVPESLCVL